MNARVNDEKGVTLIALVVTIIVLLILAGVGIGAISGTQSNINQSENAVTMSDLTKIQQVVMETYIKYKQTENERVLKGIKMENFSEVQQEFEKLEMENSEFLKVQTYDNADNSMYYYKLEPWHLQEMGLENVRKDEYIVNYSTGEVFDITNPTTLTGQKLYIYAK